MQRSALEHALVQMRGGHFFAAHEAFEELFRTETGPARIYLQALAQLAASHHQLTLGRGRAAVRTWHKARAKLLSVGALEQRLDDAMQQLHERHGIGTDGPRFIDVSQVGPVQSFPVPSLEALHRPSA